MSCHSFQKINKQKAIAQKIYIKIFSCMNAAGFKVKTQITRSNQSNSTL